MLESVPPGYCHAPSTRASSATRQYGARMAHPDTPGSSSMYESTKPRPIFMCLTLAVERPAPTALRTRHAGRAGPSSRELDGAAISGF